MMTVMVNWFSIYIYWKAYEYLYISLLDTVFVTNISMFFSRVALSSNGINTIIIVIYVIPIYPPQCLCGWIDWTAWALLERTKKKSIHVFIIVWLVVACSLTSHGTTRLHAFHTRTHVTNSKDNIYTSCPFIYIT